MPIGYTSSSQLQRYEGGMAVTSTTDPLLAEHYRTWLGFARLIRYVLAAIVITLLLLAYFLL